MTTAPAPSTDPGFLDALRPLLPDLSVGALLGFATALALKAVGRIVLIVVGLLFIALQLLSYFDLISINWLHLQSVAEPALKQGSEQGAAWFQRVLLANLPFAGAFTAGFLLGLRMRV
ncbi:FUN14 domain-containing protein [Deinococcus frigens]|uniref:FUN14 domain-containing protein n=1 Tax=Deinococcus frigens TaxID=249403 RepID=UPI0004979AD8|nr:FUN14 domain-containing protein [Deinococcus frigens]